MANFTLNRFLSTVFTKGFARPVRYEVTILPPPALRGTLSDVRGAANKVSLFCEISALPQLNVLTRSQRTYGPLTPRPFGVEYGGEGLTMTFYVDQEMDVKTFFDKWIQSIVNPITYNVSYMRDYTSNIIIDQLNEQDEVVYRATIEEAFPRSMNLLELNASSVNQIHRLNVTFTYRRYTTLQDFANTE
ncbi:MAG: hypothetical protein EBU90_07530 [Proteobacteria bacterium]|nr:hypothetical protein [Pseudomonadota bacterium]NBP13446.1 hypothetical protein [bacterium]